MGIARSTKIQLGLVGACVLFWGGILGWTVLADHGPPPGYLDDRSFPDAAEPICADAVAEVDTLGNGAEVDSIEARATLVTEQDEVLTAMLSDLRSLSRPAGNEGDWIAEWLDDWDTHIADREAWAARLQAGEDPPFVETAKGNYRVSEAIDTFAETNDMDDCATLGDL